MRHLRMRKQRKRECDIAGSCPSESKTRNHYKNKKKKRRSYKPPTSPPYQKPKEPQVRTINVRTTVPAAAVIKTPRRYLEKH